MKLNPIPFEQIRSGIKVIELRLNDPKRRQLKVGDQIIFSKLPDLTDSLVAEVHGLTLSATFADLFLQIDPTKVGYANKESLSNMTENMFSYYSLEDQNKFGVVAIHLALSKNKHIDH